MTILEALIRILFRHLEDPQMSRDAEYDDLTRHLDHLDNKILNFWNFYIQICLGIIGGAFYLSSVDLKNFDQSWLVKIDCVMFFVSAVFLAFILSHLAAWKRYRNVLSEGFRKTKRPTGFWFFNEFVMCGFIFLICLAFLLGNPLNNRADDNHNFLKIIITIFSSTKTPAQ